MVDLTVLGISLQGAENTPILLLHPQGTDKILCLGIGPMEAFAISTALHGLSSQRPEAVIVRKHFRESEPGRDSRAETQDSLPRPMTHDLTVNCIQALGGRLAGVEITHVRNEVFFAEIVLSAHGAFTRVDCRPSDGVALALRCGALLRCSESVLAFAENIDTVMNSLPEHVRTMAAAKLTTLAMKNAGGMNFSDFSRVPLVVEPRSTSPPEDGTAPQSPEEPHAAARAKTGTGDLSDDPPDSPTDKDATHAGESITIKGPKIRVSLVRHGKKGDAEFLEEFHLPARTLPKEEFENLSVVQTPPEGANPDDERWAVLLRLLSPSTKVPM